MGVGGASLPLPSGAFIYANEEIDGGQGGGDQNTKYIPLDCQTEIQVAKEFGLTILERLITTGHSLARSHY